MSLMTATESKNNPNNQENGNLRDGMAEIKQDAKSVREDLEVLKEDAAQLTSHATAQAIEAVKIGAKSAGEVATSTGEKMKKCHTAMNKQVRARPTASVLLALGAGVMIGRVLSATRR